MRRARRLGVQTQGVALPPNAALPKGLQSAMLLLGLGGGGRITANSFLFSATKPAARPGVSMRMGRLCRPLPTYQTLPLEMNSRTPSLPASSCKATTPNQGNLIYFLSPGMLYFLLFEFVLGIHSSHPVIRQPYLTDGRSCYGNPALCVPHTISWASYE